jgi:hypothetical protein
MNFSHMLADFGYIWPGLSLKLNQLDFETSAYILHRYHSNLLLSLFCQSSFILVTVCFLQSIFLLSHHSVASISILYQSYFSTLAFPLHVCYLFDSSCICNIPLANKINLHNFCYFYCSNKDISLFYNADLT